MRSVAFRRRLQRDGLELSAGLSQTKRDSASEHEKV